MNTDNFQIYSQANLFFIPKNKVYLYRFKLRIKEIIRYLLVEREISVLDFEFTDSFLKVQVKFGSNIDINSIANQIAELSSDFLNFSLNLNGGHFWSLVRIELSEKRSAPRCLVIGGAGYIGSHVTKELLRAGYEPIVFDNLSTGREENLIYGVQFIKGDVRNHLEIKAAMKNVDAVIYLAAYKAAGESMENPGKYAINNIYGAINVLNAMVEVNVNKIIFSSTAAVYGEPNYLPVDENHQTEPINFYGFTKLKIEKLLKWYDLLKGIKFFSLRYFNAVGYDPEGQLRGLEYKPNNLLPILMEAAKGQRKFVEVFGDDYDTPDGSCIRDYVHVSDLASAHVIVLKKLLSGAGSEILNLGSSSGISVFEMINEVKKVSGVDFEVIVGPRRLGDPEKLLADSSKAKKILGWVPKYSDLETIVKTTWEVYK